MALSDMAAGAFFAGPQSPAGLLHRGPRRFGTLRWAGVVCGCVRVSLSVSNFVPERSPSPQGNEPSLMLRKSPIDRSLLTHTEGDECETTVTRSKAEYSIRVLVMEYPSKTSRLGSHKKKWDHATVTVPWGKFNFSAAGILSNLECQNCAAAPSARGL